jgi:hypothetical protein
MEHVEPALRKPEELVADYIRRRFVPTINEQISAKLDGTNTLNSLTRLLFHQESDS